MQLPLYPLKCDIVVFDATHFSVFVKIAGFDKLVKMSFCIRRNNTFIGISSLLSICCGAGRGG